MLRTLKFTVAMACVGGVAWAAAPIAASANGAVKQPLLANTLGSCNQGAFAGQQLGKSTVTVRKVGGTISVLVKLRGAAPNGVWHASLVQTPSGENCLNKEFTVATNAQGNGGVSYSEPAISGTTGAFVLMTSANGAAGVDNFDADTGVTF